MHYYNNTVGIIIFYNNNFIEKYIKVGIITMEICHFFVIFYDFVMKCVYKRTIYTFVGGGGGGGGVNLILPHSGSQKRQNWDEVK